MTEPMSGGLRVVLAARPNGRPLISDFRIERMDLPDPADGEVLLRVRYLSLDPYMRGRMDDRKSYRPPTAIDDVMEGEVIAEVVSSNDPGFAPGEMVLSRSGWVTHAVSEAKQLTKLDGRFAPVTTALGVLGMPGFTAYAGMRNIGRPKKGETVVVAAASGPVGSLVGQLAKREGARAIGIAGGPDKGRYLRDILGFDAAIDHRSPDFASELADACPDGIDVYFENVGGKVWQAVLPLLNHHARIPACGVIANYNGSDSSDADLLPATMAELISRRLTITGFINFDFADQRQDFVDDLSALIAQDLIRYRETIVLGLENAPQAFIGMLEGTNFGKLLVDVASAKA